MVAMAVIRRARKGFDLKWSPASPARMPTCSYRLEKTRLGLARFQNFTVSTRKRSAVLGYLLNKFILGTPQTSQPEYLAGASTVDT